LQIEPVYLAREKKIGAGNNDSGVGGRGAKKFGDKDLIQDVGRGNFRKLDTLVLYGLG